MESLRLKFTNEPSIFVDGDLDESIKRSASDRLGDLVPQVRARTSPGVFRDMALLGLCFELSFSKPIYVGMSVVDLSKWLMYDFYYNHLKKTYGNLVKMCYTDTDSVIIHVTTADISTDMLQDLDDYDTSNYQADHPLFSTANKKDIGKFKDELGGKVMAEFVGIRPKMYSYAGEESGKRAKGVKKSVLKKTISHDDYRTCLLEKKVYGCDMPGLRSYKHTIHGEIVHKVALAPPDTKGYILEDGITTRAFGHEDIPAHTQDTPSEPPSKPPIQPPTLDFSIPQLDFF